MFLGLKHSRNYLLIYITVFIGRLLGALQKKTFDVLSALMGMNCDFFGEVKCHSKGHTVVLQQRWEKTTAVCCQVSSAVSSSSLYYFACKKMTES